MRSGTMDDFGMHIEWMGPEALDLRYIMAKLPGIRSLSSLSSFEFFRDVPIPTNQQLNGAATFPLA